MSCLSSLTTCIMPLCLPVYSTSSMKSVLVEEAIQERLVKVIRDSGFELGVLIGRQAHDSTKDYILLACPLIDESPASTKKRCLEGVTRDAVVSQMVQISRMLVGGLSVCGLYGVSKGHQGRRGVEALQRLWPNAADCAQVELQEGAAPTYLHLNADSSQFTAKSGEARGELGSVELKFQALAGKLSTMHALVDVSLDVVVEFPANGDNSTGDSGNAAEDALFKSLLKAVRAQATVLDTDVAVVSGKSALGPVPVGLVELYAVAANDGVDAEQLEAFGGAKKVCRVRLEGSVAAVGVYHEKESEGEGLKALRSDVSGSLHHRIELLAEESSQEHDEQDDNADMELLCGAVHKGGVLPLPRRVLLPVKPGEGGWLLLCDYLLPGEEAVEASARFARVLGLDVEVDESSYLMPEAEVTSIIEAVDTPVASGDCTAENVGKEQDQSAEASSQLGVQAEAKSNISHVFLTVGMVVLGLLMLLSALVVGSKR